MKETEILQSILSELQKIRKALEPKVTTGTLPCYYEPDNTTAMNCKHCGKSPWLHSSIGTPMVQDTGDQKPRYEICIAPTFPPNNYVVHDHKKDTMVFQGTNEECESYIADQLDGEQLQADQKPKWPESWKELPKIKINVLYSDEVWQAFLAFRSLYDLRNAYRGGWKPDWKDSCQSKHVVVFNAYNIEIDRVWKHHQFLSFETQNQAEHFLKHHRELIEQARELL